MSERDETAAGDMLVAALADAHERADEIRPRVHPDNADSEFVLALAALCLEVRALTLAFLGANQR